MSQSGYTPIQLYRTTTAAAAPTSGNLAAGELAINLTDEKLFFKNAAGTVKTLASSGASTVGGSNTQVQFNSSGVLAGSSNFVFDGTNVGIGGVTLGAWAAGYRALQIGSRAVITQGSNDTYVGNNWINDGANKYIGTAAAALYGQISGAHQWLTAPSGTAGNTITFTQAMTLDASSRLGVNATDPSVGGGQMLLQHGANNGLVVNQSAATSPATIYLRNVVDTTPSKIMFMAGNGLTFADQNGNERMRIDSSGKILVGATSSFSAGGDAQYGRFQMVGNAFTSTGHAILALGRGEAATTITAGEALGFITFSDNAGNTFTSISSEADAAAGTNDYPGSILFSTTADGASAPTERARITSAGYLEATYSDEVVALGNSGTATSIDLRQGNVFTATLTGNCTFTLTNPNANSNRGSSFTLILTNDGTAGRTVAWAGGAFRFPGGAATLSRTTTANAVDIWVFFTPNNGTTWYGNISMKNMIA